MIYTDLYTCWVSSLVVWMSGLVFVVWTCILDVWTCISGVWAGILGLDLRFCIIILLQYHNTVIFH